MEDDKKQKQVAKEKTISLSDTIYEIFKHRAGIENGLTRREIMDLVYGGRLRTMERFEQEFYWRHSICSVIHRLRNVTKMFIISTTLGRDEKLFYVVKTQDEAEYYKNKCKKEINGLERNMRKCETAVKEKWYESL